MPSVILLGAGASFGSGEVKPHRPPLGNDPDGLFTRLEAAGGLAASLPNSLKTLFRSDFEKGMAEFYEYANGNIMRFQREMAAYLAQFSPGESNAYIRLIRTIGSRGAIYASLNYDLLFELAAGSLGWNTQYHIEPIAGSVRLLKLHGSSNFWPYVPPGNSYNITFEGFKVDVQSSIHPLNQEETLHRCINEHNSLAPAIAMYAVGKQVKVSPDYIEHQQQMWRTAIAAANRIFVVGVRVHNADVHVWGELAKADVPLTYFGLESDRPSFETWKTDNGKTNAGFIEATFEQCIDMIGRQLGRI